MFVDLKNTVCNIVVKYLYTTTNIKYKSECGQTIVTNFMTYIFEILDFPEKIAFNVCIVSFSCLCYKRSLSQRLYFCLIPSSVLTTDQSIHVPLAVRYVESRLYTRTLSFRSTWISVGYLCDSTLVETGIHHPGPSLRTSLAQEDTQTQMYRHRGTPDGCDT